MSFMSNFRIIPRLEIKSGNLIKGMRMEGLRIIGDPKEFAFKYYKEGADELIIDDVVASLYSRSFDFQLLKNIAEEIRIPITVQGGIRNINDIHKALNFGADKVCINTGAILNPKFIYQAARTFGSQCISVGIQGKNIFEDNWEAFSESGRNRHRLEILNWIDKIQDLGAGEVFFISIDNDGMENGTAQSIIDRIQKVCKVPFLVGGGISKIKDIESLLEKNIDGCIISKYLHNDIIKIFDIKKSLNSIRIHER